MRQNFVEYFDIHEIAHRVRTLDPHQVPPQDTHAQPVAEGRFPCMYVGGKCIPFFCLPFSSEI